VCVCVCVNVYICMDSVLVDSSYVLFSCFGIMSLRVVVDRSPKYTVYDIRLKDESVLYIYRQCTGCVLVV